MSTIETDPRDVEVVQRPKRRGGSGSRLLLACGVLSATHYVATDLLGGLPYPGDSFTSEAISELVATGARSEPLVDPLFLPYGVLALAFGVGVNGALVWMAVLAIALLRRAPGPASRPEPPPSAERRVDGSRTRGIEEAPGVASVAIERTARALPAVIPLISGLLLGALPCGVLEAQQIIGDTGPVRGEVGGTLFLAAPVGEFDRYIGLGGGVSGFAALFVDETQTVGLRLDGSFMIYGDNTVRRPLSPTVPFVYVDVTTRNGIASFGLGPQVQLGQGPVRPFLRGSVGFSYFATTTSVEGTNDLEPFASSTNFDDWTFTLTGGGGLRIRIAQAGDNPIALDLAVTYVRNGETDYLREGGIREGPGGSVIIEPIRSETNLVTFHVGVAVGLR